MYVETSVYIVFILVNFAENVNCLVIEMYISVIGIWYIL